MTQPALVVVLCGVVVLVCATGVQAAEESKRSETELRGVYMELHSNHRFGTFPLVADKDWPRLFHELKGLGVNAVFPQVVSPSGAVYPSQVVATRPEGYRQGFPDLLQVILEAAHAEGLEVHPWTIEWYQAPRGTSADRLVRDVEGKTTNTLCPSVSANRELMREMILELVTRYRIDGVQYDYMRLPGAQYCYCATCRAGFEKRLGRQVVRWPDDVAKDGELEAQYVDFLCDAVSGFVEEMHPLIKQAKPRMVISAAVWCNMDTARNVGVRQDWGKWVEHGWIDFVAPMNYANQWILDHFEELASAEARNVAGRVPLVYGIGAYQDTPEGQVNAVRVGRRLGGSGFIVYTLTEDTFARHLPALSREVWAQPATVPSLGRR